MRSYQLMRESLLRVPLMWRINIDRNRAGMRWTVIDMELVGPRTHARTHPSSWPSMTTSCRRFLAASRSSAAREASTSSCNGKRGGARGHLISGVPTLDMIFTRCQLAGHKHLLIYFAASDGRLMHCKPVRFNRCLKDIQ